MFTQRLLLHRSPSLILQLSLNIRMCRQFSCVLWFVESAANVGSMHSSRPDPLLGAVKAHRSNPAKTCKNHKCTKCRLPMRHLLSSHNPRTPVRHVSVSASQPRGPWYTHTHSAWNNGPTSQSLQQSPMHPCVPQSAGWHSAKQHLPHSARTAPEIRLSSPNPCLTATPTGHTPLTARDIPPESSADTSTLHIPQSVAKHGRVDEPVMTLFSRTVDCQKAKATSRQLCCSFPCASKSPSRSQANVVGVTRSRIACN